MDCFAYRYGVHQKCCFSIIIAYLVGSLCYTAYYHDQFLRGKPDLAGSIDRVKPVKGASPEASSIKKLKAGEETEPNFYEMPALDERAEQAMKDYVPQSRPEEPSERDPKDSEVGEPTKSTGDSRDKIKRKTRGPARQRKRRKSSDTPEKKPSELKAFSEDGTTSSLLDLEPTPMNPGLAFSRSSYQTPGATQGDEFLLEQQRINMLQQQNQLQFAQNAQYRILQHPMPEPLLNQHQMFLQNPDHMPYHLQQPQNSLLQFQQQQQQLHLQQDPLLRQMPGPDDTQWSLEGHLLQQQQFMQPFPSLSASEETSNMFLQQQHQLEQQRLQQQQLQQQQQQMFDSASIFSQQQQLHEDGKGPSSEQKREDPSGTNQEMGRQF